MLSSVSVHVLQNKPAFFLCGHSCIPILDEDEVGPTVAPHVWCNSHEIDGKTVPCSLMAHITKPS